MSNDANEESPPGDTTPPPGGSPGMPPNGGYDGPQETPLTLGEAIRQLPRQYVKVVTRPSAAAFAEEVGKARWVNFPGRVCRYNIDGRIYFGNLE